jgi:protease I
MEITFMAHPLKNKKIAILIAHGFEQSEMTEPLKALEHAGATVEIISPEKDMVRAWKDGDWAEEYIVNVPLMNARADDYHGLVLPGGVMMLLKIINSLRGHHSALI